MKATTNIVLAVCGVLIVTGSASGWRLASTGGQEVAGTDQVIGYYFTLQRPSDDTPPPGFTRFMVEVDDDTEGNPVYFFNGTPGAYMLQTRSDVASKLPSGASSAWVDLDMSVSDGGSKTFDGHIYVEPSLPSVTWLLMHPIYETDTGEIYATNQVDDYPIQVSDLFGGYITYTSTSTQTLNTSFHTASISTTFKVTATEAPGTGPATFVQMDAKHQVLSTATYKIGAVPDAFTPSVKAACLVVKTAQDVGGKPTPVHQVYSPEDGQFDTFDCSMGGICARHVTKIYWP